jgi:hypothetical protein
MLAYTTLLEKQAYDAVAGLFAADAEITLGSAQFRNNQAEQFFAAAGQAHNPEVKQTAFRLEDPLQQDSIVIGVDGQYANAIFHCQVEVSIPHDENSTLGGMACLQGQYASSRWVDGRFAMNYHKVDGNWKISRLEFQA